MFVWKLVFLASLVGAAQVPPKNVPGKRDPFPPKPEPPEKPDEPNPVDAEELIKSAKKYNPNVNAEKRSQRFAKYYRYFQEEYDVKENNKKDMLCSTFLSLTEDNIDAVVTSIHHSQNKCDWLVIIYKVPEDSEKTKDQLMEYYHKKLPKALNHLRSLQKDDPDAVPTEVNFEFAIPRETLFTGMKEYCVKHIPRDVNPIIEANRDNDQFTQKDIDFLHSFDPCDLTDFKLMNGEHLDEVANLKFNHVIYPKISLFMSYLPYVKKYNHIWALDGDLSLEHYEIGNVANVVKCGFLNSPLVLQPVIADNTQPYEFLNGNTWATANEKERENHGRKVKAAVTGFIEIQAPMFNGLFLEWYIMSFILPMLQPTYILGADWGYDETFCKAAKYFAKASLEQVYVPNSLNSAIPCALIVNAPIHHKNSQEVNSVLGSSNKFTLSNEMVRIMGKAFPSYYQGGKNQASSPIDSAKDYLRVYEYQPNCAIENEEDGWWDEL